MEALTVLERLRDLNLRWYHGGETKNMGDIHYVIYNGFVYYIGKAINDMDIVHYYLRITHSDVEVYFQGLYEDSPSGVVIEDIRERVKERDLEQQRLLQKQVLDSLGILS